VTARSPAFCARTETTANIVAKVAIATKVIIRLFIESSLDSFVRLVEATTSRIDQVKLGWPNCFATERFSKFRQHRGFSLDAASIINAQDSLGTSNGLKGGFNRRDIRLGLLT
jgi:hypothetical protein